MTQTVRVRYAPSPTGEPHVGNIRTALFNWLFARHSGGSFIVRIEDTDAQRRVQGANETILESLRWLGLDWDEGPDAGGDYGPYFQSERLDRYREAADRLVQQGDAYHCYCTPERLDQMRKEQQARKQPPGYDGRCRDLTVEQREARGSEGLTPVVRFKVPAEGLTVCRDYLRGKVEFENRLLDDFVILKSDGYPTYHLASVVDDTAMRISHVMRAEEWLSSTPRHVLLYAALGYEPPVFVHLPILLGPDRAKLSKRHAATSMLEYPRQGYLPEAMFNFLTLLGWSLDDQTEVFSREQAVRHFSLERIGESAAIFNQDKLLWMNGVYIRRLSTGELTEALLPFLEPALSGPGYEPLDHGYLARIVPLVQERLKLLSEGPDLVSFFFARDLAYDPDLLVSRGLTPEQARHGLSAALDRISDLAEAAQHLPEERKAQLALGSREENDLFKADVLEQVLRALAVDLGFKTGQFFGSLRVAVTGRTAAPPLFETMEVLGRERCLPRVEKAAGLLQTVGKGQS